jgi:hypothetical protein
MITGHSISRSVRARAFHANFDFFPDPLSSSLTMSLNTVPADILLEIVDYLSCSSEILHLYLTVRAKNIIFNFTHLTSPIQSSRIADALTPALYSRIILRGPAQCMRTLDMLYSRPDRARHVRSLKVNPDSVITGRASRWGRSALPDGYAVSSAVRRAARNFEVLRCFAWDGEELPPYDDMWFALRILCVYHNRFRHPR